LHSTTPTTPAYSTTAQAHQPPPLASPQQGKCEYVNPGGSVKDRVALQIITEAEASGHLTPGDTIYEGTSGSTGISLAMLARAKGYKCCIYMPDDAALEK
ncbi:hypothetical protein SARC_13230, partial [Sphaeroforma arctica JP610]